MKLSEIKGEEALDVLADLIEPVAMMMTDDEIQKIYQSQPKLNLVKYIIKNHKSELIEIMAILERKDPKEYAKEVTILSLPKKLLELLNDEDLVSVFQSQVQSMGETSSGLAMVNTEVEEN